MADIKKILDGFCIPYAYDHFAEGESPDPPFLVYKYPGTNNFVADGRVYFKVNRLSLELYTDYKNPELETSIEDVLDANEIVYEKTETWIDSEKMYEVLYEMEV